MSSHHRNRHPASGRRPARAGARLLAWLTLVAVLFGALAPAWAQVIVRASAGASLSYIEVCTSAGLRRIAVDAADSGAPAPHPAKAIDAVHCAFCLTQHQLPCLLGAPPPAVAPQCARMAAAPARPRPLPAMAALWRPPPRAPPVAA